MLTPSVIHFWKWETKPDMIVQSEILKTKKKISTFHLMSRSQRCEIGKMPWVRICPLWFVICNLSVEPHNWREGPRDYRKTREGRAAASLNEEDTVVSITEVDRPRPCSFTDILLQNVIRSTSLSNSSPLLSNPAPWHSWRWMSHFWFVDYKER